MTPKRMKPVILYLIVDVFGCAWDVRFTRQEAERVSRPQDRVVAVTVCEPLKEKAVAAKEKP